MNTAFTDDGWDDYTYWSITDRKTLKRINELIKDMGGSLFPAGLPKLLWRLKVVGPKTARLIILGIKLMGGKVYKKYRVYEREL